MGSVMSALMIATFLSTVFIDKTIPAEMGVSNVIVQVAEDFTSSYPTQNDLGRLRMDIQVRFSFNLLIFRLMSLLYSTGM